MFIDSGEEISREKRLKYRRNSGYQYRTWERLGVKVEQVNAYHGGFS